MFSLFIRHRDGLTCQKCLESFPVQELDCSHHFPRAWRSTRWDPENCVALCRDCHEEFGDLPKEYVLFMIRRLGLEAYQALARRAKSTVRYVDEAAIAAANRKLLAAMGVYPGRRGPALSTFWPGVSA